MNSGDTAWKVLAEKPVYENPWISVTEYDVLNPAGRPGIYGKVHFKHKAIGIIPLDGEGNIYLVGQTRFVLSARSWEIPAGGGPLGEDPLETAKRELQEETGLVAGNWQRILEMHLSNSISDEHGFIFLATDLKQGPSALEDTEDITVRRLPFQEAFDMVVDGRITDSPSIMAILRLRTMLDSGEVKP